MITSCRKENDATSQTQVTEDSIKEDGTEISTNTIKLNFLPVSNTNQVIKHKYYTLSYNEEFEQAEWVAYELKGIKAYHDFERPFLYSR